MSSLFDSARFNDALFFPRPDVTPPPPRAIDRLVEVEGARLHLRWHRPELPAVVLYFHGNGELVADYDGAGALFEAHAGAGLAVMDYRGYGASTGAPTLRAALDDAHAVLAALEPEGRPIVVMGRSLGGQLAAELYARAPRSVVGWVFESSASDLRGIVARRGIREAPSPDDLARFDPLPKLRARRAPALVLHGMDDALIPFAEAEATAAALGGATLVGIPGRGHDDLSMHRRYWEALGAFVRRTA